MENMYAGNLCTITLDNSQYLFLGLIIFFSRGKMEDVYVGNLCTITLEKDNNF